MNAAYALLMGQQGACHQQPEQRRERAAPPETPTSVGRAAAGIRRTMRACIRERGTAERRVAAFVAGAVPRAVGRPVDRGVGWGVAAGHRAHEVHRAGGHLHARGGRGVAATGVATVRPMPTSAGAIWPIAVLACPISRTACARAPVAVRVVSAEPAISDAVMRCVMVVSCFDATAFKCRLPGERRTQPGYSRHGEYCVMRPEPTAFQPDGGSQTKNDGSCDPPFGDGFKTAGEWLEFEPLPRTLTRSSIPPPCPSLRRCKEGAPCRR